MELMHRDTKSPLRPERSPDRPLVLGHRGFPLEHPENSIPGLLHALSKGADGVEFDVRLAADDVPVLSHDADLYRTHRERIPLRSLPSARLPVPTLAATLVALSRTHPGCLLDIEVKESFPPHRLAETLDRAGWTGQVVVSSFDVGIVREYTHDGTLPTGLLIDDRRLAASDATDLLAMSEARFLGVRNPVFLRSLREALDEVDAALWLWTLNRRAHLKRAMRLHADAVISDNPVRAVEIVRGTATHA